MKRYYRLLISAVVILSAAGCGKWLDIVPDNVLQYEDLFSSREKAYTAMGSIYSSTLYDQYRTQPWTLGDEWVIDTPTLNASRTEVQGSSIMRGFQTVSNPLMSFWTGNNYQRGNYQSIRDCDMFINNVDRIPDMTAEEKADWKGQALFLKGYYLFILVQYYGPVVLPVTVNTNDLNKDLLLPRSKVDECFQTIVDLMDQAIPLLKGRASTNDLGQVDKCTAMAMKARVLLYWASPFYNGNSEYYGNFLDTDGKPFFNPEYKPERWKAALDAVNAAIETCEENGFSLYHYEGRPYDYDRADWDANTKNMQTLYDLKFRITERYNNEIIWGTTKLSSFNMPSIACIKKPASYGGPAPAYDGRGYGSASLQAIERYYTEHGLPLEEDRTVNRNTLFLLSTVPEESSPEYNGLQGFMQPGATTINMYLHREPRFYADLGITGGYYRSHQIRINTMMFYDSDGGYIPGVSANEYNCTGIAIQKCVHPESYNYDAASALHQQIVAPAPLMRLSDLYLMKAEALNEVSGPSQEVYDALNKVRRRAGIPDVEYSYTNTAWVTDEAKDKHRTQEGLREIILNERNNEFAFENANRFSDMQRWKRSVHEFSEPIWGWNYAGRNASSFFSQTLIQARKWSITDCLWPIDKGEMEKNSNLIQNPGW